ncbi:MAG: M1 family metallopeptidase [Candidatus Hermodarchaeota archaeon]|nr:M1 family metallopeptidase [Candidatus Hermodarchaeota archaeon]
MRTRRSLLFTMTCLLVFSLVTTVTHPLLCIPIISTLNQVNNLPGVNSNKQPALADEINSVAGSIAPPAAPTPLTNYSIDALLLPLTHHVNGSTTINYVNHATDSLSELYFHLYPNAFQPEGWIEVFDVLFNDTSLPYMISGTDDSLLWVNLVSGSGPGVLAPGQNVTLDLLWQVLIPERFDRFGVTIETEDFDLLAFNLGNWHPIVSVYDDRGWDRTPYSHLGESFYSDVAIYDVDITVPNDYVIAATGELESTSAGGGTRTWHFVTGPVRDFTWCASPHYQTLSVETQGVNVTSYHIAGHELAGQRALEIATQCLEVFGNRFGPYPWESLQIVEADFWAGGMEYPQLVMIGTVLYDDYAGLSYFASVVAHEIGHEWIPFTIGTDSYTEPWIDEGFASFCEYVWVEHVYGPSTLADYRLYDLNRYWGYVANGGDESINQSMAFWQNTYWDAYGSIVYSKAALVYDMLRHQLGDGTFYQAWQDIYSLAIHQNVRARTIQQYFETSVGESLDWFFEPWVFGSGVVTLSLGAATLSAGVDGWTISFTLLQSASTLVRLRVPLAISFGATSEVVWVWMEASPTSVLNISVSEFPLQLTLDPEQLLLCQYGLRSLFLALGPGSPILYGVVGIVVVTALALGIVIIWKRRRA